MIRRQKSEARRSALPEPDIDVEADPEDLEIVFTWRNQPRTKRMAAIECDTEFQNRMRDAIAAGLEHAPTSVSTAPCTSHPIYVSPQRASFFAERWAQ